MKDLLRPFILLGGLLAILIAYYWVHKPITPELALALGGLLLDVLTVSTLIAITGGLGRRILTPFTLFSRIEHTMLASALGLGVYALLALLLGLIGMFNGVVLWGGLAVCALLLRRDVRAWGLDLVAVVGRALRPDSAWTGFLALFVWVVLLAAALVAFAPPVAWDALAYHLVAPQVYLAEGRITAQPENFYLGLSQNVEMLYSTVIALFGRDTAAAPLHLWFGVVGMALSAGVVRRITTPSAGWMAVVLPLTSISVWVLLGYPYVDLAVMAYSAAVLVIVHYSGRVMAVNDSKDLTRWWVLMGVLIGLAMGVKYTAGVLLASAVLAILHHHWGRVQSAVSLRSVVIVGVAAGAAFLPWMLKGVLLYDNPIYPFLFDGLNWSAARADFFNPPQTGLVYQGAAWQVPILPLAATVFGVEKTAGYSFSTGVWLFTAPLLLLFTWRYLTDEMKALARDAVWFAAPILLFWMGTAAYFDLSTQTRLMTMLFPPMIVLGALGFHGLAGWPEKPIHISFVVRGVLVLTLVFGLLDVVRETTRTRALDYHLSRIDRSAYILNDARAGSLLNALLEMPVAPGSRVRFLWEPKGYLCPDTLTCIGDELLDHWRYEIVQGRAPDDIFAAWRAQDDYLLVFESGRAFLERELAAQHPGMAEFNAGVARWLRPVWSGGGYVLYVWQA